MTGADAFHAPTDFVVNQSRSVDYYVADTRSGLVVLVRDLVGVVHDELDLLRPDLRATTREVIREAFLTHGLS